MNDRHDNFVHIAKIFGDKHIVKGIVYKPNEPDAHDDWMSAEDIEEAAYRFMKNGFLHNIDTNHDLEIISAYVCESYIAVENDPDGFPVGAWIIAVKIEDDDIWDGILSGDFTGFSMFGLAHRIDNVDPPETDSESEST